MTKYFLLIIFCAGLMLGNMTRSDQKPWVTQNAQGEANVRREMPTARRYFGKRDWAAWSRFDQMKRNFEKPTGFEGEAEMEAAWRVLNGG